MSSGWRLTSRSSRAMAYIGTGDGWIGSWSPGIGDPNVMGWVTVVAYAAAGWQCVTLGRKKIPGMPEDEKRVWRWLPREASRC